MHHTPLLKYLSSAAVFVVMLLPGICGLAQTTAHLQVPPTANSSTATNRGPSGTAAFQRAAAIYSAADMGNLDPSFPINSLGFNITLPALGVAAGNLKVYLVNTTDPSFLRSTTWATLIAAPTPMQLVYDGPYGIINSTGWNDVQFTTPFTYTGGGIYMAFEWTRTSAATPSPPTYAVNSLQVGGANGWRGATNNTAMPATLGTSSSQRPWIRLGYTGTSAGDLTVNTVYALGKLPLNNSTTPNVISASVTNLSNQTLTNRTFTLDITGANTFTTTTTVPTINPYQTITVSFPGYTPANLGVNTITVTAPTDDVSGNNTATYSQIVDPVTIAYAQGSPPDLNFAAGLIQGTTAIQGGLFTKYTVSGPTQISVPVVRVGIAWSVAAVGKRVFAVVLDANGVQIGRSAGIILQNADLGELKSFAIINPPTVSNTDFYVGLAVTASPSTYYPVGTQAESPTRTGAYFTVEGDTTFTGSTPVMQVTTLDRFVIEADLVVIPPPAIDLGAAAITGLASGCGLSSTQQVCVTIENFGSAPQSNIPVSLIVNGGTPITETVAGPVAAGGTLSYCFTQTLDLSSPGTYSITAVTGIAGDANAGNDSTTISINSFAPVQAAITGLTSSICISDAPVALSGSPAGGTFSGPGVTGTSFDPAAAGTGTHTITYTATQGQCSGTATADITVNQTPAAPTTANQARCGAGTLTLTATAATGDVVWYTSAAAVTPIATGTSFTTPSLSNTTTYYVASVLPGGCESPRVVVEAIINQVPDAAFTFSVATGNTVNFTATTTGATYSWTFANGTPATSTAANPTVTFPGGSDILYPVTLTVTANGCSATTTQAVQLVGRADNLNNALSLYPNPSTGMVQIEVGGTATVERVEVYSALGQQVKSFNFAGQQQVSLDLSGLAEGAYTLRVTGQNTLLVKQVLLQK